MHYPVTKERLEQELTARINEAEAELEALKKVVINTSHKTLTNRAVENGRIGDYIGIGKALYVSYQADHRYMSTDMIAYTYNNPDGSEIGVDGFTRISRTMTPTELREQLDKLIEGRKQSLHELKLDLVNAKKITTEFNKLSQKMNDLLDGTTWATRGVLK